MPTFTTAITDASGQSHLLETADPNISDALASLAAKAESITFHGPVPATDNEGYVRGWIRPGNVYRSCSNA